MHLSNKLESSLGAFKAPIFFGGLGKLKIFTAPQQKLKLNVAGLCSSDLVCTGLLFFWSGSFLVCRQHGQQQTHEITLRTTTAGQGPGSVVPRAELYRKLKEHLTSKARTCAWLRCEKNKDDLTIAIILRESCQS